MASGRPHLLARTSTTLMKPIVLTPEQRRQIERRRKDSRDRRVYQRLTAVLIVAEEQKPRRSRSSVGHRPHPIGRMAPRLSQQGTPTLYALFITRVAIRASSVAAHQVDQLKEKVSTRAASATPIRSASGFQDTFGVSYSPTGMKDLLRRVGVSYHKVSGFPCGKQTRTNSTPSSSGSHGTSREGETLAAAPTDATPATTSMRVIPFGAWTWCIAAGCWSASVCWWVWAQDASG